MLLLPLGFPLLLLQGSPHLLLLLLQVLPHQRAAGDHADLSGRNGDGARRLHGDADAVSAHPGVSLLGGRSGKWAGRVGGGEVGCGRGSWDREGLRRMQQCAVGCENSVFTAVSPSLRTCVTSTTPRPG